MSRVRVAAGAALLIVAVVAAQQGYRDTPILPGQKWHVHDPDRPHPAEITPAGAAGGPPSDAVIVFDGKDLSHWAQHGRGIERAKTVDAKWKVANGYFEVVPRTGDLFTRESFGDSQIHIEWEEPADIKGSSQDRGNSGVYVASRYEIQVLDSYRQLTYSDGQAGALYGQWPPLVNPIRKPGEWNVYDIVYIAPRFDGPKVVQPAYITLFFNGVMVHNKQPLDGNTEHRILGRYQPHGEAPLLLQDHGHPVRFRNVWVRRLAGYDQPEK
jgi:Domain of Unknown Function (DUF1080)